MNTSLVIHDDHDLRRTVASWLKERHWTVHEAGDRAAGLGFSSSIRRNWSCAISSNRATTAFNSAANCASSRIRPIPASLSPPATATAPIVFIPWKQARTSTCAGRWTLKNFPPFWPAAPARRPADGPPAPAPRGTRLKFWGVRGSIPTPGPETVYYGGNTSCVEVRVGGEIIILDSGSGIRPLGRALAAEFQDRPIHLSLLITHTHWDHIQGFPFFMPAYNPRNRITMVGFEGARQGLQSTLSSQMESPYFPISMHQMPGTFPSRKSRGSTSKSAPCPCAPSFSIIPAPAPATG